MDFGKTRGNTSFFREELPSQVTVLGASVMAIPSKFACIPKCLHEYAAVGLVLHVIVLPEASVVASSSACEEIHRCRSSL